MRYFNYLHPVFIYLIVSFIFPLNPSSLHADIYTFEENGVITITSGKGNQNKKQSNQDSNRRAKLEKKKNKRKKRKRVHTKKLKSADSRRAKRTGLHTLPKRANRFKAFVKEASQYYDLPEALIWGVMKIESNFNPRATSNKGAQGLMQLMPYTAKDMGVEDSYNPEQNIFGAARLLRILANRFNGDLVLTLSAYHAGGGAVSQQGGIPYEQTARYVRKTLNAYYGYMDQAPYQRSSSNSN